MLNHKRPSPPKPSTLQHEEPGRRRYRFGSANTPRPTPIRVVATRPGWATARHRRAAVAAVCVALFGGAALPAAAQLGAPSATDIALKGWKFNPNKVTVAKGDKVNFVWKETVAHNVVVDSTQKSPTQNKGVWTATFAKAGVYNVKCTLHHGMRMEITVK